jgi:DNA-binding MarR family transcriptional regulator
MDKDVLEIQRLYPRIYVACHTEHDQGAASESGLSWKDSSLLAHLTADGFTSPSKLAAHLNVTRATLSEALSRLEALGYLTSRMNPDDERKRILRLTEKGARAVSRSSVLDYDKLKRAMDKLSSKEKARVLDGMGILARAAGRVGG